MIAQVNTPLAVKRKRIAQTATSSEARGSSASVKMWTGLALILLKLALLTACLDARYHSREDAGIGLVLLVEEEAVQGQENVLSDVKDGSG